MPNLNEYYHLLQTEQPPFDDDTMRGLLRDALERADAEAANEQTSPVENPVENQAKKRPALTGISVVGISTGIVILVFTLWFVSQKTPPIQSLSSEVSTPTAIGTQDENTVTASEHRYTSHSSTSNGNLSSQDELGNSTESRLMKSSEHTSTRADSIATPPDVYPADSLLPEDFRNWQMPSPLAWAVAERRYNDGCRMLDNLLRKDSGAAISEYNLYCLRGHLYKAMDSVEASITAYSRALSLQESGGIYLRRGTQYFTANKREEAYQDFDHAVRLDPKDAQAVFMRGAAAYNLKRFEEACDDWYLAAQMGHPLADSILAVKCTSMLPKYARVAIAERKWQMKTILFLLDNIKENLRLRQGITLKESAFILDSLSYKSLGGMCDMNNILDRSLSTICMIHLLYKMTLEIHDNVASNFVQNLAQNAHSQARSNFDFSRVAQPNIDQTMRSIDYNKQIVDAVASPNPTRFEVEKVQSLQNLQRQQTQALERSSATKPYSTPSSQTLQSTAIIQQMRTYLFTKYAEFMEE